MFNSLELSGAPLLELGGVCKSFVGGEGGEVQANWGVDLTVRGGEIHALLGENGAGKSTLVQVIYGLLQADAGVMRWEGREVADLTAGGAVMQRRRRRRARELGIAMVFQHFSLFESLSVEENIALGLGGDWDGDLGEEVGRLGEEYGLAVEGGRAVYSLSVGERQRIEVLRCLLQKPKLLIMDEPTSVLTPQEVGRLFDTLRRLAGDGMAILYISHKLGEIKELCGRATVLRGGRVVEEVDVGGVSVRGLAGLMMGGDVGEVGGKEGRAVGAVRLEVRGLCLPAGDGFGVGLRDVNLEVRGGEIVGIAGVAGNGQDELLAALNGERVLGRGEGRILIDGVGCGGEGVRGRRRRGLGSIPQQRLGHAAVVDMDLRENGFLTGYGNGGLGMVRRGFVQVAEAGGFAEGVRGRFGVRCGGVGAVAGSLSGGNLQKFVVGREICQGAGVLVVCQPTWGVDAGAAGVIHGALRELAAEGAAILVISQDLDELMGICDRVGAICGGRVSEFFEVGEVGVEEVGVLMGGGGVD